jgi:hypothetical protein
MKNSITSSLKRFVPIAVKNSIKTSPFFARYRSSSINVYHCSVYRTGSQWIRRILSDRRVCRYSGLLHEFHVQRIFGTAERPDRTTTREFPYVEPFRERRIVTICASYENYVRIPKPKNYKTFFVFRDPRDVVVSHYFASRRDAQLLKNRDHYRQIANPDDGIPIMIDRLEHMGLFSSLRSWASIPEDDPSVLLLRFEELIGPRQYESFKGLFAYCDIAMPDDVLKRLLEDHSFRVLAGGRQQGEEDATSHYRMGVAGDWKNHFTDEHVEKFKAVTNDLVILTGYEW